jgi:hypothetical protein
MSPKPDPLARERRRLWLLAMGLKVRWDLWTIGMRGRLTYHGAIVSLIVGVIGLLVGTAGGAWGYIAGVAGVALSVALLVPEWIRVRRSEIALVPAPIPAITRSTLAGGQIIRLPQGGRRKTRQIAVVWDEVDDALPTSTAVCEFTRERRHLPGRVDRLAYAILMARPQSRKIFNGRLVRQDSDLLIDSSGIRQPVRFSRTDYFSMACSNYLTEWHVLDRKTGSLLIDGAALFLRDGDLIPLSENHQANGIGVSTLAFTSDGKMVMTVQSSRSASEPGLLAPAGSGSIDLRDVRRAGPEKVQLVSFIARAMQRELVEESNIHYRDIEWTEVLGYYRWLNKGGKPEYVGVTRLKRSADELAGRDVRLVETPFVQRLDFDGALDFLALIKKPESLLAIEERLRQSSSMPLFMGIRALGRALSRVDRLDSDLAERLSTLAPH